MTADPSPEEQVEFDLDRYAMRARLRALPDPGPMPGTVAARIEEALRAEAERAGRPSTSAATSPATAAPTSATVLTPVPVPSDAAAARAASLPVVRWTSTARPRWIVGAAAATLVIAGVAGTQLAYRGNSNPPGAGVAAASVPGTSTATPSGTVGTGDPGGAIGVWRVRSGTDYRPETLARQVAAAMVPSAVSSSQDPAPAAIALDPGVRPGQTTADGAPGETSGGVTSGAEAITTLEGLAQCAGALGVAPAAVRFVDLASYQGRPAAVIVAGADEAAMRVFVVERSCRAGQPGLLMSLDGPLPG